ncbi:MAG: PepSY domain-containing protein [Gemmatimonadaceae bacterium]|nr:PepSY domain-containing protein [Gemmatimonadaceae bacterium]
MTVTDRVIVPRPAAPRRRASRIAFYAHLWLGVIFTAALLVISATGILLNHKRGLGLMPDVAHEPSAPFAGALSLDSLTSIALVAVGRAPATLGDVDRMDVRPRSGYVKVRVRDARSTEVTVDLATGRVLHVGPRGDVYLEKLHSGEAFGDRWVLLSDAAAIALVITIVSGYWLWLFPKVRRARDTTGDAERTA